MHKGLLCSVVLDGGLKEAVEQTIDIPAADVEAFRLFQFWLDTDKVVESADTFSEVGDWRPIAKADIFAEAHGIPSLWSAAIDAIVGLTVNQTLGDLVVINALYYVMPVSDPFRGLLVDLAVHRWDWQRGYSFGRAFASLPDRILLVDVIGGPPTIEAGSDGARGLQRM